MMNKDKTFVSIIIPVKEINDYIRESIPYILRQDCDVDFEIIIFPDHNQDVSFDKTRIIPTGCVGPAEKRDLALTYAKGDILAFIDDDAYPGKNWLRRAVADLEDEHIGAVGGPAVTPKGEPLRQKASGEIYSSIIGSGPVGKYRYVPGKRQFVDDFPTVNLFVKKEVFRKIGGFDTDYYPGEDTKLCLDIVKMGKKILYDPKVVVYHHRRKVFSGHLKQVRGYALHRGFFVKRFPETSFRIGYFLPSIFVFGLFFGWMLGLFHKLFLIFYFGTVIIYLGFLLYESYRRKEMFFLFFYGVILTHIIYGVNFVRGLLSKRLIR